MIRTLLPLAALLTLSACGDSGGDSGGMDDMGTDYEVNEATELATDGGSYYVSYTTEPSPIPYNEYFSMTLTVADGADHSVLLPEVAVSIDARMPQHGHGMNTAPTVTPEGDGTFTVEGMLFHMQGFWEILVEVDGEAGLETATFEVDCCQ